MVICIYDGCKVNSNFNFVTERKALYCCKHKLDGMINVKNKKCSQDNCQTIPIYNFEGNKNGLYCFKHKLDGMINVKNKKCSQENCNTLANYNFKDTKIPLYCSKHKLDGMINVRKILCIEKDCNIEPIYNYKNIKTPIYCFKHKKDNMINIKDINKHCIMENCNIIAIYNKIGTKKGLYCANHKLDGMIDVISKKCSHNNCYTLASFNYEDSSIPISCTTHKKENMINVKDKNKLCKTPLCDTLATVKKYDGYCFYCYLNLFPDSPIIRNFKTKEKTISEFILDSFKEKSIIIDKPIYDGCSKKRPDIFLDLGYQVIIIEIDENQHISYETICENKRLMQLSQDINHRPLILIRFNPDNYINENNDNIESCWKLNKKGLCVLNNDKIEEWNKRLRILKDTINYWVNQQSKKTIEIIYLFYNCYKNLNN